MMAKLKPYSLPLAIALWAIAMLLFVEVYLSQTIYSGGWYISIVIFFLFLSGTLLRQPSSSAIYVTFLLQLGLLEWSSPKNQSVLESYEPYILPINHENWRYVFIFLMLALGVYTFADSERGRLAFQHWSLKIGAVLLLTLVFMAWMGEFYIRSDYAHQRLGPYPPRAALEYRQQRPYQGAADMPFELDKPDNVLRVLVLGDSYTYGDGVLAEDRYANQLQAYDTENLEVIVLARNGASTKDELEFWRQNGIQTNPDIVIVGVVTNDPDIGRIKQRALINKPIFANRFNRSQFAFYLDAIKAFPFLRDMSPAPDGLDYGSWQDALYEEENFTIWQTDYLQPLYDEITASGAQAWAYILSHPLNRDIDTSHFTRLEIAFRNAGFQTINLVPVLRERFPNSLDSLTPFCAFPNDCHPNARLHASYAEIMWEDLRPFIPRP